MQFFHQTNNVYVALAILNYIIQIKLKNVKKKIILFPVPLFGYYYWWWTQCKKKKKVQKIKFFFMDFSFCLYYTKYNCTYFILLYYGVHSYGL